MGGKIVTLWGDFQLGARLLTFGGVIIINMSSQYPRPCHRWQTSRLCCNTLRLLQQLSGEEGLQVVQLTFAGD